MIIVSSTQVLQKIDERVLYFTNSRVMYWVLSLYSYSCNGIGTVYIFQHEYHHLIFVIK